MQHIIFEPFEHYRIAILTRTNALYKEEIDRYYVSRLHRKDVIAFDIECNDKGKATATIITSCLENLMPVLDDMGSQLLLVTDTEYFKRLAKVPKVDSLYGTVMPCQYKGFEHMKVVIVPSYRAAVYDLNIYDRINFVLDKVNEVCSGTYVEVGADVVKYYEHIPADLAKVRKALGELYKYDSLTLDTETFSLKHNRAGLGTIGFAWNEHEGICIDVDHGRKTTGYVTDLDVAKIMMEIKDFLTAYKGNIKYHNATYDMKILIRWLWMKHLLDNEGLLEGLDVLTRNFDCTRAISYLAINTTTEYSLSLKSLSQQFMGRYAVDVKDIRKVPTETLSLYNAKDCMATWYVFNKNYPVMVADEQLHFYETMAKPMLRSLVQTELTGIPINMETTKAAQVKLQGIVDGYQQKLSESKIMQAFCRYQKDAIVTERNLKLKKKQVTVDDIQYEFNTGSYTQVSALLHDFLEFEVVATTKSGSPAVGRKALLGHSKRTDNKEIQEILDCINKIEEGKKILSTFITQFLDAERDDDGWHWLFGSFNFGGTISGRLSSSDPNLQNLPSGSTYGKLIKECVQAPEGWLFVGLDFNSLEDNINILLTKDPAKRAIRLQGFDGHSYRCYNFWSEMFPHIDPTSPESINSLKDHPQRGKAKAPHFALQYLGTAYTLVKNCGFDKEEATRIEERYLSMFKQSYDWLDEQIEEACRKGFATLAFGLRLRTPLISKTILGTSYTPRAADAERRSAGNAISGQSYGLLNSRLAFKLQEVVVNSPYKHHIKPCAQIHDANYQLVRNDSRVVAWLNHEMRKLAQWQELPELMDPDIILDGELDIFYPTWANGITIKPVDASEEFIEELCASKIKDYYAKKAEEFSDVSV